MAVLRAEGRFLDFLSVGWESWRVDSPEVSGTVVSSRPVLDRKFGRRWLIGFRVRPSDDKRALERVRFSQLVFASRTVLQHVVPGEFVLARSTVESFSGDGHLL